MPSAFSNMSTGLTFTSMCTFTTYTYFHYLHLLSLSTLTFTTYTYFHYLHLLSLSTLTFTTYNHTICWYCRQQQQLAQLLQTLRHSEEYANLSPQQLQSVAMSILVKEQHKQQVNLLLYYRYMLFVPALKKFLTFCSPVYHDKKNYKSSFRCVYMY